VIKVVTNGLSAKCLMTLLYDRGVCMCIDSGIRGLKEHAKNCDTKQQRLSSAREGLEFKKCDGVCKGAFGLTKEAKNWEV
jgi:hypothetical protein